MTVLHELLGLLDEHKAAWARYQVAAEHWRITDDTQPRHVADIARQRMYAEMGVWDKMWHDIKALMNQREDEVREALRAAVGKSEGQK